MKFISTLLLFIVSINAFAQNTANTVEMADVLYANGKIYLVVAVLLIIFAGIIFFLIRTDRKLSRLEKQIKESVK